MAELHQALVCAAAEAACAIMAIYAGEFDIAEKPDGSPVTQADAVSESIILRHLTNLAPDILVIAEEAFAAGHAARTGCRFFLVDPLDGTREFINRNGEFTVNIALIENGKPVAGVVLAPAIGRLFATDATIGAYQIRFERCEDLQDILAAPRLQMSRSATGTGQLRAVASRSHRDSETESYLRRHAIDDVVSAGSSLKFCLLAAGEAEVYPRFGPTMQWDTAAGHAVLRAVGGEVYQTDGVQLQYGGPHFRNPAFIAWYNAEIPVPL